MPPASYHLAKILKTFGIPKSTDRTEGDANHSHKSNDRCESEVKHAPELAGEAEMR